MSKKVLTILPYKLDAGSKEQLIHFSFETYLQKLITLNIIPVLVPSIVPEQMLKELYEECSGVLLMGGADISPSLYNKTVEAHTKVSTPKRDAAEKLIIEFAIRDKKPILGICRGMQIVNSVMGGSLNQHLPEITKQEEHWVPEESYDAVARDRDQYMSTIPGTKLAGLIGEGKHLIHCAHHQSIDQVAKNLKVNAKSPQGIIEGLEIDDTSQFLMLLHNHIETQSSPSAVKVWQAFANAVNVFAK